MASKNQNRCFATSCTNEDINGRCQKCRAIYCKLHGDLSLTTILHNRFCINCILYGLAVIDKDKQLEMYVKKIEELQMELAILRSKQ
jgi:hypothetical protein